MRTQTFTMEITDKTGQFPVDAKKLERLLNDAMPQTHVVTIHDTGGDQ